MTIKLEVYKCECCGNMIEVIHAGQGELSCCDKAMVKLTENTTDAAKEKHVPVIEKVDGGYKVSVGSTLHPMDADHYIEWVEFLADGKAYRRFFEPGQEPVATFEVEAASVSAREFCNKHGLWKA